MEMAASKDGRWLVLFSLAIGIALAWTYTPLFLTPLGVGMGAALFGADGSAVAFFVASALTYLANAALASNPRAKAALGYGTAHAAMGVIGVLLVGSSLAAAPDAFSLPGTISNGIELGGEATGTGMPLILDACLAIALGCIGAALAYIVVRWIVWAPLDKPKVAMTIGFLMLIVTIVCLPTAGVKVISVAASQPTSLRDLDEEKRERLSDLIVSHGLTAREAEVFALLVDDLDAATIAQRLSVSNATVHTHISHVYTKFGVHSRKELERMVQAKE